MPFALTNPSFLIFNPIIGGFRVRHNATGPDKEAAYSPDPNHPDVILYGSVEAARAWAVPPERIYSLEEVETLQRVHDAATARALSPIPQGAGMTVEEAAQLDATEAAQASKQAAAPIVDYGGIYQGEAYCPACIERIADTLRSEGAIEPSYKDSDEWPLAFFLPARPDSQRGKPCAGGKKCCHAIDGVPPYIAAT